MTFFSGQKISLKRWIQIIPNGFGWKNCRQYFWCLFLLTLPFGCGQISVVGIQPEYPPVKRASLSLFCDYVEVQTVQPTFRWQPFPGPSEHHIIEAKKAGRLKNVTYELRIWKSTPELPSKLVYGRKGISDPYHTIEEPLIPSTHYLWSIRAHFLLDGHTRVTEWSLAGHALRGETVPNQSCLRFITPGRQD